MTDREAVAGLVERLEIYAAAKHLWRPVEQLQIAKDAGEAAIALHHQAAEIARLEKERDNLKLQAQGHAMEARSASATIYDAYQAVTGATGEPGNWNGAEPIKAELDRLRALVAEAVRVVSHFRGYGCPVCSGDCGSANPPVYSCPMQDARAFIEKAKS